MSELTGTTTLKTLCRQKQNETEKLGGLKVSKMYETKIL